MKVYLAYKTVDLYSFNKKDYINIKLYINLFFD
jgi:hypothetical protein